MATTELSAWSARSDRKPLVIRGARHVGKTHLVESFGRARFAHVATLNFKRDPLLGAFFDKPDIREAVALCERQTRVPIRPGQTLLVLDDVQAEPRVLGRLPDLAEALPELHVIAAGSLLDLPGACEESTRCAAHTSALYLHPMTFEEFLLACGDTQLLECVQGLSVKDEVPGPIGQRLQEQLRTYLLVGGMPAAVDTYAKSRSLLEVRQVHKEILASFRDDFARCARPAQRVRLHKVFGALPRQVGRKFVAAHVDRNDKPAALWDAFRFLGQARLLFPVRRSASNGAPLSAEADENYVMVYLLDVGLCAAQLGLEEVPLPGADGLHASRGILAMQFAGQQLRAALPPDLEPELYCWVREQRSASAEVNFVMQKDEHIVPVLVKAGAPGHLRSLHMFLRDKHRGLGVRLGGERPELLEARTVLPTGAPTPYWLLSLPLYLAGQVKRLLPA